jgi:hypothetical protein
VARLSQGRNRTSLRRSTLRGATGAKSGIFAPSRLPALGASTPWQRAAAAVSIAAVALLLAAVAWRIVLRVDLWCWWMPLALLGGAAAADLASGLVHWGADTWGRDDCPFIGRRLLVPFRVHHVNPDDFLRRTFVDTNGDVALITIPCASLLLVVPLNASWGFPLVVCGLAFCGLGTLTNQIHQWSHMPAPPRLIRALQSCHLLLGRAEHAAHHRGAYDRHYCITTGWWNRPLEAIGFFRGLERAITGLTGVPPRQDDRRYKVACAVTMTDADATRG